MAEYKQIHKVEVEKKPFTLTKKMIALLVIAIVLVVGVIAAYIVTADKDGYTSSVQNSSSEVISGDVSVTKKGLYEYLLDNYGANEVLNEAYNKITAKEITDKDAINTKVKELKYECGICLELKHHIYRLDCGCNFELCRQCYSKLQIKQCPGCRKKFDALVPINRDKKNS